MKSLGVGLEFAFIDRSSKRLHSVAHTNFLKRKEVTGQTENSYGEVLGWLKMEDQGSRTLTAEPLTQQVEEYTSSDPLQFPLALSFKVNSLVFSKGSLLNYFIWPSSLAYQPVCKGQIS